MKRFLLTICLLLIVFLTTQFLLAPPVEAKRPPGTTAKTLTEISLVSTTPGFSTGSNGETCRFLWEPSRYDPSPTEVFLEVVGSSNSSTTFELLDTTTNTVIPGSSLAVTGAGRYRTSNLVADFPSASNEIVLQVSGSVWTLQRSAILVQQ